MSSPSPKTKPSQALALLRISTNRQDNARQRADIEKVKKKFGLTIVETIELDGVSGRKVLKDARFLKILDDLGQRPDVHGLALSAIDRFFRTDRYSDTGIFQPLADHRKLIWSAREGEVEPWTDEGFDTCMTAALKSGAEWRELRRRTMDGKRELAGDGILPHSNAWYGVDIIGRRKSGIAKQGKAVINAAEAEIVVELFTRRDRGQAGAALARMLNERGIRGKGSKGNPPAAWSGQTIRDLLTNTSYIGRHLYDGIPIAVPRIVSDELFYAVQTRMQETGTRWCGRPSELYLLRRFLFCALCNHPCVGLRSSGSSKHPKLAYRCGNRTNKPPVRRICHAPQVRADLLEPIAWAAIWAMLKDPQLLFEMGHAHYAGQGASATSKLEEELKQLNQQDRNLSRMMKSVRSDEEYDELEGERKKLRARIEATEGRLRAAGRVVNLPPLDMLRAHTELITSGPEPSTYARRRNILEGLTDLRMEYAEGELVITGAVDIQAPGKNGNSRVHATPVSYQPNPFVLRRRIA